MNFLTLDEVIALHHAEVAITGEPDTILNLGALESALMRPQQAHNYLGIEDIPTLAAKYLLAIGQAHAFLQGNKRTAFRSMELFALLNGYELEVPEVEAVARMLVAYITGRWPESRAEEFIRYHIRPGS